MENAWITMIEADEVSPVGSRGFFPRRLPSLEAFMTTILDQLLSDAARRLTPETAAHAARLLNDQAARELTSAPVPMPVPVVAVSGPVASHADAAAMLSRFGLAEKTKVRQMLMTHDAPDQFEIVE
jgi:hypothetical protein